MVEQVTIDWVEVWLRDRDEKNLLVIANPRTRILGFAERDSCNAVLFNLTEVRCCRKVMKIYESVRKLQEQNPPSGMICRWLNVISSN